MRFSLGTLTFLNTNLPVPLIYIGRQAQIAESGALCDVAPTMLYLMGLDKPSEMNGRSLLTLEG